MTDPAEPASNLPVKDWNKTLDLDRSTVIKDFVTRIEDRLRAVEEAQEDLKALRSEAKAAIFGPREVKAMFKLAKLRLKDQRLEAAEDLAAIRKIGTAIQFDLFGFADE